MKAKLRGYAQLFINTVGGSEPSTQGHRTNISRLHIIIIPAFPSHPFTNQPKYKGRRTGNAKEWARNKKKVHENIGIQVNDYPLMKEVNDDENEKTVSKRNQKKGN